MANSDGDHLHYKIGQELWQGPAPDSDHFVLIEARTAVVLGDGDGVKQIQIDMKTTDGKHASAIYFIPVPPNQ